MLSAALLNVAVGDLQRNYLFKVQVSTLPLGIGPLLPTAEAIAANVDLYTEKFKIPESANKPIEFLWAGEKVWYAGPNAAAMSVALSLRCDNRWNAYKLFKTWKDLGGTDVGQVALPKIMTLGTISLLTVDVDKSTIIHAIDLLGCQILKIGELSFEKGGDAEVKFDVTIHYESKLDRYASLLTV
jgi:hypothetical protein